MSGGFVELEVRPAEGRYFAVIELELPCGLRLRFPPETDTVYLGRLVLELDR